MAAQIENSKAEILLWASRVAELPWCLKFQFQITHSIQCHVSNAYYMSVCCNVAPGLNIFYSTDAKKLMCPMLLAPSKRCPGNSQSSSQCPFHRHSFTVPFCKLLSRPVALSAECQLNEVIISSTNAIFWRGGGGISGSVGLVTLCGSKNTWRSMYMTLSWVPPLVGTECIKYIQPEMHPRSLEMVIPRPCWLHLNIFLVSTKVLTFWLTQKQGPNHLLWFLRTIIILSQKRAPLERLQ